MEHQLTPKQRLFVEAYLSNGLNAADACRQAGYKGNVNTIKAVGTENLAKPYIRAFIEQRQAELREQFAERRAGLLADVDEVKAEILATRQDFPDNPTVRVGLIGKRLDAIEKEAKLTGAYVKDAPNPADHSAIIRETIKEYLDAGADPAYVLENALKQGAKYGVPEKDIVEWVH